ncbi:MAG: Short chain fatty acid transporter [Acidobacteria bacterium]|nr:MAG: Short chain fatty acid transporter [Acidobacteriota bacterium]
MEPKLKEKPVESWLAASGLQLSDWFERWFPDAFALALVAVTIVYLACVGIGNSPIQTAQRFGAGFWDLVAFTMQMTMIIISGYALATAGPVYALICRMAAIPTNGRNAAAFVAMFSMLSSLLSWSFSLIFSGLLAREVAHRVRGADYRAMGAAGYLGIGSIWALGLSSSAALIMAAPASLPQSILRISGVIPLSQTLGLWQGMIIGAAILVVSMLVAFHSHPTRLYARDMQAMGVKYEPVSVPSAKRERPGEWLEYSPLLTVVISFFGIAYLVREVADKGPAIILDLNHYIFAFLVAGLLLHWRPRFFVHAVAAAVPSVAGVLIQYPLYGGIVKMMTESGLAKDLAHFFVTVSTHQTFPVLVGIYSTSLGLFVPSAGGRWLVEAPYVLEAAKSLQIHLGWVVQIYNATEALANLIHPFWMLPILGILGLKARDIIGYTMLQFAALVPVVLFLVWALNHTF